MTILEKLRDAKNINDFAPLLGFRPKMVAFILYKMPRVEKCYETFTIPKKNGGLRKINSPNDKLKLLQRRLATLLYDCYDEIIKENKGTIGISHGFKRGYDIFTNSRRHCRKRYVFNVDLKDFFPSINFGRVRGFFLNDKNFKLHEKVATIIAQIACYENQLPQGSPVSPMISNLIGNILDIKILKLAKNTKCYYTRYADDLTFSTNNKQFPKCIADENNGTWLIGDKLKKCIEESGFKINKNKVNMQYKYSRQTCVGLVINKKVNIKNEYYRKARAMCNNLFNNNTFYIEKNDQKNSIAQLEGILNFIYWIKQHYFNEKKDKNKEEGIKKLYGKYLFYKHFINTDKPIILTEGKTDVIYLKCALKNLIEIFPDLIENKENRYNFKIKFFTYTKLFRTVMSFAEGTTGLLSLMHYYKKNVNNYILSKLHKPIILIVDNDEGAKGIRDLLKIRNPITLSHLFYGKLYVLFVDKNSNIEIENLFDEDLLNKEIDGKKFKIDKKDKENDKYFGKYKFAQKIILPNYSSINFVRFKPLFFKIREIINNNQNMDKEAQTASNKR
jgi:hypothetical protein